MRKLVVTCECGQRMQVPRSAVGRKGMCPTCGKTIAITGSNATVEPGRSGPPAKPRQFGMKRDWWQRSGQSADGQAPEDAKRRFGQAVDLYYSGKYAESLAIFNDLVRRFPGNPKPLPCSTQVRSVSRRGRYSIQKEHVSEHSTRCGGDCRTVIGKLSSTVDAPDTPQCCHHLVSALLRNTTRPPGGALLRFPHPTTRLFPMR